MPLYAYRCAKCGADFEVRLSFAEYDRAKPKCPACGGRRVQRRIAKPGMKVKRGPALTRAQMDAAVGLTEGLTRPADGGHEPHPHDH